MENTGYLCFLIVLKMLNIKSKELPYINGQDDLDTEFNIIRTAKELNLKVKRTRFKKKLSTIDNELENGGKKFGFSWFIPTIIKYKKQFISVLLAVFVI